MTIARNASRLIASALALGTAAMPALAATPANPEPAICAQSDIIANYDAFLTTVEWVGWTEANIESGQTTLIFDGSGNPDYYTVEDRVQAHRRRLHRLRGRLHGFRPLRRVDEHRSHTKPYLQGHPFRDAPSFAASDGDFP